MSNFHKNNTSNEDYTTSLIPRSMRLSDKKKKSNKYDEKIQIDQIEEQLKEMVEKYNSSQLELQSIIFKIRKQLSFNIYESNTLAEIQIETVEKNCFNLIQKCELQMMLTNQKIKEDIEDNFEAIHNLIYREIKQREQWQKNINQNLYSQIKQAKQMIFKNKSSQIQNLTKINDTLAKISQLIKNQYQNLSIDFSQKIKSFYIEIKMKLNELKVQIEENRQNRQAKEDQILQKITNMCEKMTAREHQ